MGLTLLTHTSSTVGGHMVFQVIVTLAVLYVLCIFLLCLVAYYIDDGWND